VEYQAVIKIMVDDIIELDCLEATKQFGIMLGQLAMPGDIICLDGDLGAGKTTLTQAIAIGLEVPKDSYITSPTFAILHEYSGRLPLYHMDFYRLNGAEEIEDLGFEEYFYLSGLTVIEWPDRAAHLIPDSRLYLTIRITGNEGRRIECDFGTGDFDKRIKKKNK